MFFSVLRSKSFQPLRRISFRAFIHKPPLTKRMADSSSRIRLESDSADQPEDTRPEKKPRLDIASDGGKGKKLASKHGKQGAKKRKARKHALPEPYSPDDVVARDVAAILGQEAINKAVEDATDWDAPFEQKEELELAVSGLSSSGESLSVAPSSRRPWVVVTPFALPGETIRVRVYRHARLHSYADLLEVVTPNPELRDMSRVHCKYFGKCSGCQYQMLSYDTQLDLKRTVVVKAYQNFSELPPSAIPPILSTMPSPLQYGYRTKITPHFDAPPKKLQNNPPSAPTGTADKPDWLNIGFNRIGTRHVMDIEECPIATPTLNEALIPLREAISKNAYTYKKSVSLLLRDSLEIPTHHADSPGASSVPVSMDCTPPATASNDPSTEKHICVTDHKATVRERVGDKLFEYVAGSFFQNNNSVLLPLTSYVRDAIFPVDKPPSIPDNRPTHLVDAYCGSGLFAITLAPHFETVAGIELSADSIRCATKNAEINSLSHKCTFRAGDAADIFATVQEFPRDRSVLIIDPPRKGTDEKFVEQLLRFGCATVVYVSCNVHTQARDVGMILRKSEEMGAPKYVLETLRGFDLFPQTAHVESVAVLRRI